MVEVNGRQIESNGCFRSANCFECEQKDCTASVHEIYLMDKGKSIEEAKEWYDKTKKHNADYVRKWRKNRKENLNNGC